MLQGFWLVCPAVSAAAPASYKAGDSSVEVASLNVAVCNCLPWKVLIPLTAYSCFYLCVSHVGHVSRRQMPNWSAPDSANPQTLRGVGIARCGWCRTPWVVVRGCKDMTQQLKHVTHCCMNSGPPASSTDSLSLVHVHHTSDRVPVWVRRWLASALAAQGSPLNVSPD